MTEIAFLVKPDSEMYRKYFKQKNELDKFVGFASSFIDKYDYSDLHHNLVWNTRIFMWGSIRDDSDRAFCPGPDEGVLARPRSVSEALGAHIHAVSCLCGCDVSVTEAFELHGEEIVERE